MTRREADEWLDSLTDYDWRTIRDWVEECAVNGEDLTTRQCAEDVDVIRWADEHYVGGVVALQSRNG